MVTAGWCGVLLSWVLSWDCGEVTGRKGGWLEIDGSMCNGGKRGCVEEAGVVKRLTGGDRLKLMGVLGGGVVNMLLWGGVG